MFNRKKREIKSLNMRLEEQINERRLLFCKYRNTCNELDEQSKRLEELERSLVKQKLINKNLVEDHEEDLSTIRALREKIDEAQRHTECPADCKHRSNPNACRTCVRYPKAKDKYEVGIDA